MFEMEEDNFMEPEIQLVHKHFYSGEELDGGRNQHKLDRITVNPDVMQGKPCIRGMRITISMVLGLLISGYTNNDILNEYPMLEEEDILQAKNYAYVLCGGYYDSIGN